MPFSPTLPFMPQSYCAPDTSPLSADINTVSDPFRLLIPCLGQPEPGATNASSLLVADENLVDSDFAELPMHTQIICNRFDIACRAEHAGMPVIFNDFDFSALKDGSFDRICYRVSKEKAVTHHIINQSRRLLRPGGTLFLSGAKGEGLKTYARKAGEYLGGTGQSGAVHIDKRGNWYLASATRAGTAHRPPLDDSDYAQLRPTVWDGDTVFFSKPGIYGWDKIDRGSALLVTVLEDFLHTFAAPPANLLDLGCGYGYLAAKAAQQGVGRIVATDNCAAAVGACRRNFAELGIVGDVVLDDCAGSVSETFCAVICNPPFHQGFSTNPRLLDAFLTTTARRLQPAGRALFVVNEFVPLEKRAATLFSHVALLVRGDGFKVLALAR